MPKKALLFLFSILLLLTACTNKENETNKEQLTIFTTVYPLQYFTERIGGDFVETKSIYPPGSDEHTFEPTQKDMIALSDADLFFYIGLGLEGFVEKAEKTLSKEHVQLIATASNIDHDALLHGEEDEHHDHDHDHDHGDIDPHVWMSPKLAHDLSSSIKDALIDAMPEHTDFFEQNFQQLNDEINALDLAYADMVNTANMKIFYVSHAAFGYLAHDYGLEQVAVAGIHSQSEPSQSNLIALVDRAKKEKIKYIFFEQNVSSKLTKIIQDEIGAESLTLHNLSVLTTQDLQQNEDYFSLMYENLKQLKKALQ